jgi:hypothetical protein
MTENTTDERMAKLPRWAQDRIALLKRELVLRGLEIDALTGSPVKEPGRMTWGSSFYGSGEHGIPDNETVTMYLAGDQLIEVRFQDGAMVVNGSQSLSIVPQASNVIWVRVER